MSATSYGWLVLAFPLAGMLIVSLGWRVLPGRLPGWIASVAILGSFIASILALIEMQDLPAEERHLVDSAWTYAATVDFMTAAPGVTTLDSTDLDFDQTVAAVLDLVEAAR